MTPKGLYIHLPYCVRKCAYCDFCSLPEGRVSDSYIDCLIKEARLYTRTDKIAVDTVYLGGGTPSLLTPKQLDFLLSHMKQTFDILTDAEITMEVNPGTVSRDSLAAFRRLGINRLSIGLQSIHENELKILGRIHNFDKFLETYSCARAVGFDNISVDLMYGIPEQTEESFGLCLEKIIDLAPEHISAYGLIVEEGTPFFDRRQSLSLPTEDEECRMYYLADRRLSESGYSHYEISNYARADKESRHNLKYWRDLEYIGLGASAYSYFEGARFGNTRSVEEYLSGEGIRADLCELTESDVQYEYAMMRLRLKEGISLSDYEARFGESFLKGREKLIADYVKAGLLTLEGDRLAFTPCGFYVSNTLLTNLL